MQVDAVPAPVLVENAGEVGKIEVDHFLKRQRERRSIVVVATAGAGRERHVLPNRKKLHRSHEGAEDDGAEREEQSSDGNASLETRARAVGQLELREGEIQCKRTAREERVLEKLWMRAKNGAADGERESAPRPLSPVADAANEEEQRERQQRADVELSVVTWRHVPGDRPTHEVRDAPDDARDIADSPRTKKQVREEAGEKDVNQERPRHGDVGRQDHAKEERRIENVAVHSGNVWHTAKEIGIPEWNPVSSLERCSGEFAKWIARKELVAARIDEKAATERGKSES